MSRRFTPSLPLFACFLAACGPTSSSPSDARGGRNDDGGGIDARSSSVDARPRADGSGLYGHTITIDGNNDFDAASESLATSSQGYTSYVAWDSSYLYVAMQGADIASNDPSRFLLIYIGTDISGSTLGALYNTQEPNLPFSASYHLRWKADNLFTNAMNNSGDSWVDAAWDFSDDVVQSGEFVELRIPLVDIGSPSSLSLHISMINETNLLEGSYAAVPSTSFVDGYDPDYSAYYHFDLQGMISPADHSLLP